MSDGAISLLILGAIILAAVSAFVDYNRPKSDKKEARRAKKHADRAAAYGMELEQYMFWRRPTGPIYMIGAMVVLAYTLGVIAQIFIENTNYKNWLLALSLLMVAMTAFGGVLRISGNPDSSRPLDDKAWQNALVAGFVVLFFASYTSLTFGGSTVADRSLLDQLKTLVQLIVAFYFTSQAAPKVVDAFKGRPPEGGGQEDSPRGPSDPAGPGKEAEAQEVAQEAEAQKAAEAQAQEAAAEADREPKPKT